MIFCVFQLYDNDTMRNLEKMSQNLSSAAVMIGPLRVKL